MDKKIAYGSVSDTDDSLKGKTFASFGLNQGCKITTFELNPHAGQSETEEVNALMLTIVCQGKEYNTRWFEPAGELYGKGNTKLKEGEDGYYEAFNAASSQLQGSFVHALKSLGVSEASIQGLFTTTPATSFTDYATRMLSLLPANFKERPVDVFLEYQWNISEGQDRTYLQIPKNMKGGRFLCPSQEGSWTATYLEDGSLVYKSKEGKEHPFTRSADYMSSNKAIQQTSGGATSKGSAPQGGGMQSAPPKSTWGV